MLVRLLWSFSASEQPAHMHACISTVPVEQNSVMVKQVRFSRNACSALYSQSNGTYGCLLFTVTFEPLVLS
jgi:hypothetical protein